MKSLICFADDFAEPEDRKLVQAIFPYFMFISALFLIATFIVYAILPEIRNIHGVCVMVIFFFSKAKSIDNKKKGNFLSKVSCCIFSYNVHLLGSYSIRPVSYTHLTLPTILRV